MTTLKVSSQKYPLEIKNIGEDTYIVMSRGHHDVHEFMHKVREGGCTWSLGMPIHIWMRAVPSRNPEYTCFYHEAKQGDRGVFPATYAHEAHGDDKYEAIRDREAPQAA